MENAYGDFVNAFRGKMYRNKDGTCTYEFDETLTQSFFGDTGNVGPIFLAFKCQELWIKIQSVSSS